MTVLGGAAGAVLGLPAALILPIGALDASWALFVAAGMAVCQAPILLAGLNAALQRDDDWNRG